MSTTLFPSIQPLASEQKSSLKLYREIKWDYENNVPVYKKGSPVIVTGKEAVLVWAWKALHTPRFRYKIYTWDFGCETESLIGQPFTDALKKSEAVRYIKECLLINPYITGISDVAVRFLDGALMIDCTVETIYGEESIHV